jgi:hypothetical protein
LAISAFSAVAFKSFDALTQFKEKRTRRLGRAR